MAISDVNPLAAVLLMLSAAARAEPILTIFGNATPQTEVVPDSNAVTLGVRFRSTQPGKVSGIRFFGGLVAAMARLDVVFGLAAGAAEPLVSRLVTIKRISVPSSYGSLSLW